MYILEKSKKQSRMFTILNNSFDFIQLSVYVFLIFIK